MSADEALPQVRHIIGRLRHEATARAAVAYLSGRWQAAGTWSHEFNEGEKWWFVLVTPFKDSVLSTYESGQMCEAVRAFAAGRKSMVD